MVIRKEIRGRHPLVVSAAENTLACEASSELIVLPPSISSISSISSMPSQSDSQIKQKVLLKGCTTVDNNELDEHKKCVRKKHINNDLHCKTLTYRIICLSDMFLWKFAFPFFSLRLIGLE